MAARLRGFGPLGILALLLILAGNLIVVPLSAVFVLVWARLARVPWSALGLSRPRSWATVFAIGIPTGIVFKLAMKAVVMPLFGAPAMNMRYHFLAGNAAALPWMLYAVIAGAGFGEEVVFRGFFFERLGRLLGSGRAATAGAVVITSVLFAAAHYADQGVPGVEQAAVTGFVFAAIYAKTRRLWIPMVMHMCFDLTAVALIYWNWETAVAHAFFS